MINSLLFNFTDSKKIEYLYFFDEKLKHKKQVPKTINLFTGPVKNLK